MSPNAVIAEARRKGLDVIGICDHNATENVAPATTVGQRSGVTVVGGMEITSREEVHVLGLFSTLDGLHAVQEAIYAHLEGENDREFFGDQWIVDERDCVIAENERLLIGATDLSLDKIVNLIHGHDGVAIAAHIDRPSFSLISQLGFIPVELDLDAVEICSPCETAPLDGPPVVYSSDAHNLDDVGKRFTRLLVEEPSAAEVVLAIRGAADRRILEDK